MTGAQKIEAIDKQIDACRAALYRRIRYMPATSHDFHAAWGKNPLLHARHRELYRLRGAAQIERDAEEERAHAVEQRRARRPSRKAPAVRDASRPALDGLNLSVTALARLSETQPQRLHGDVAAIDGALMMLCLVRKRITTKPQAAG